MTTTSHSSEPTVRTHDVGAADVATALGSGDVPVLATPRLVAWLEGATCAAAVAAGALTPGRTSVGTRVAVDHLVATPVGGQVEVAARLVAHEGRALRFEVWATDRGGRRVAEGEVHRVVVDVDRFMSRVSGA